MVINGNTTVYMLNSFVILIRGNTKSAFFLYVAISLAKYHAGKAK